MKKYDNLAKRVFPDKTALVFAISVLIVSLLYVGVSALLPLYNAAVKYGLIHTSPLLGFYHVTDFGTEASLASHFLYLLEVLTAIFFLVAFFLTKKRFFIFFAILYLMIFFDDYLQIHEKIGALLAENFMLPNAFGLREQDIGELLAWSVMAICIMPVGAISFRNLDEAATIYCYAVWSSFAMLLFCAAVLDMIHVLVDRGEMIWHAMGIFEDGGELVAISLSLGLAFSGTRGGGSSL